MSATTLIILWHQYCLIFSNKRRFSTKHMHIPQDITQRIGLEPIFFDDQGSLKGQDSSITSPPELTGKKIYR